MTTKLPAIFANSLPTLERTIGDMNSTFVDFDRLFERFERTFPSTFRSTYPPSNIIKTSDGYVIEVAVAGYSKDALSVDVDNSGTLTVKSVSQEPPVEQETPTYLTRGIAARQFVRKWQLMDGDYVDVVRLKDGMLTITIKHPEPEILHTKQLDIITS